MIVYQNWYIGRNSNSIVGIFVTAVIILVGGVLGPLCVIGLNMRKAEKN